MLLDVQTSLVCRVSPFNLLAPWPYPSRVKFRHIQGCMLPRFTSSESTTPLQKGSLRMHSHRISTLMCLLKAVIDCSS